MNRHEESGLVLSMSTRLVKWFNTTRQMYLMGWFSVKDFPTFLYMTQTRTQHEHDLLPGIVLGAGFFYIFTLTFCFQFRVFGDSTW